MLGSCFVVICCFLTFCWVDGSIYFDLDESTPQYAAIRDITTINEIGTGDFTVMIWYKLPFDSEIVGEGWVEPEWTTTNLPFVFFGSDYAGDSNCGSAYTINCFITMSESHSYGGMIYLFHETLAMYSDFTQQYLPFPKDGKWHHYVAIVKQEPYTVGTTTINAQTITVFVDWIWYGTAFNPVDPVAGPTCSIALPEDKNYYIGRGDEATLQHDWYGHIESVSIFNKALTEKDIWNWRRYPSLGCSSDYLLNEYGDDLVHCYRFRSLSIVDPDSDDVYFRDYTNGDGYDIYLGDSPSKSDTTNKPEIENYDYPLYPFDEECQEQWCSECETTMEFSTSKVTLSRYMCKTGNLKYHFYSTGFLPSNSGVCTKYASVPLTDILGEVYIPPNVDTIFPNGPSLLSILQVYDTTLNNYIITAEVEFSLNYDGLGYIISGDHGNDDYVQTFYNENDNECILQPLHRFFNSENSDTYLTLDDDEVLDATFSGYEYKDIFGYVCKKAGEKKNIIEMVSVGLNLHLYIVKRDTPSQVVFDKHYEAVEHYMTQYTQDFSSTQNEIVYLENGCYNVYWQDISYSDAFDFYTFDGAPLQYGEGGGYSVTFNGNPWITERKWSDTYGTDSVNREICTTDGTLTYVAVIDPME